MPTETEQILNTLVKLATIGAAVVTQQAQAELSEKQATITSALLSGTGAGRYTQVGMNHDTTLQNKLNELETRPNLTQDDINILTALLDKHRNNHAGIAAAVTTAGVASAAAILETALRASRRDIPVAFPELIDGAISGATNGFVSGGLGGWVGKQFGAYVSPEARRAREIIKKYKNAKRIQATLGNNLG